MAKRLTDSGKWDDPWFLEISNEHRLAWLYILDKCNHAGIWKVNQRLADFCLNFKIDWDEFLAVGNGRIRKINPEKWFIPKFIEFQYGVLKDNNNMHRSVIDLLKKEGVFEGLASPCGEVKRKDKDKEKRKRGIVKGGRFSPPSLDELKAAFSEKGYPGEADKFMAYYETVGWVVGHTRKPMKNWRGAVATWCGKIQGSGVRPKRAISPNKNCTACSGTGKLPDGKKCWCWS